MTTKFISNKKWYFRLIPKKDAKTKGLFEDFPRNTLKNKLLTCLKDSQGYLFFTFFDSYAQFYRYQLKFKESYRGFFEVILGENSQKTHFDLDIKYTQEEEENNCQKHETIKDQVISGLIQTYSDLKINLSIDENILIFSSHGVGKRSFHIIVDKYCHHNNKEAEEIYNRVISTIDLEYREYVDLSVYKIIQQFRMLGSQKFGSKRKKIWINPIVYQGKEYYNSSFDLFEGQIKELRILERSLVSNVSDCLYVGGMTVVVSKKKVDVKDIDDVTAKSGVLLLGQKMGISVRDDRFPFSFRGVSGNIVMLKREKPSWCFVCQREHQNENPFLVVNDGKVSLYCRRNKNRGCYLGELEDSGIKKKLSLEPGFEGLGKKSVPVGFFGLKRKKIKKESIRGEERKEDVKEEAESVDPGEILKQTLLSLPRVDSVKTKNTKSKKKIDVRSFF